MPISFGPKRAIHVFIYFGLIYTYRALSIGPVFLCGGKGIDALRCISRRFCSRRGGILPPGSTLNFSMLFLKHDTRLVFPLAEETIEG
jgi:hypothetical protein